MTLENFQLWLDNYLNFEKTQTKNIFWLDSMKFLCEKCGNPQDKIPCIHVAGSKGKGSCSAMIASIIESAGYKCGVYSSPHITDFRERIGSAHGFFEDSVYEKAADCLTSIVDSIPLSQLPAQRPLTWFELVTVFGFLCFQFAEVDYAVYEVGLGGRLDSTNIVKPLASVIMPIELEHTEFLGNTIAAIAGEKAGIIKEKTPAIIALQNYKDAENVFVNKCKETDSECLFVKDVLSQLNYDYRENGKMSLSMNISLPGKKSEAFSTELSLLGQVQAQNAAAAVTAVLKALPQITTKQIELGLSNANLPGRFEVHQNMILDGAHTVKSISNTIKTMEQIFPEKKYHLLFACAGDKDIEDITFLFKDRFESVVFTQPQTVRHCDADKSLDAARLHGIEGTVIKDLKTAFSTLKSDLKNDDILLITGSFYLVSEVKALAGV